MLLHEYKYHLDTVKVNSGSSLYNGVWEGDSGDSYVRGDRLDEFYPSDISDRGADWEDAKYTWYVQRFREWAMWLAQRRNILTRKIYNLTRLEENDMSYNHLPDLYKYMINYKYDETNSYTNQNTYAPFYEKYKRMWGGWKKKSAVMWNDIGLTGGVLKYD